MVNIRFGLLFFALSLFLYFISPIFKKNILGYKSMQQGMYKDVWMLSNKCFGLLVMIGSIIYLTMAITFKISDIKHYDALLNQCGTFYIFLSILVTEVYTFISSQKRKKIEK